MDDKEINIYIKNGMMILLTSIILLIFVIISQGNKTILFFTATISVIEGLYTVYSTYRKLKVLVNPMTIFSFIWLILVPLTSMSAPLMDSMSERQWAYCLGGCALFSLGAII